MVKAIGCTVQPQENNQAARKRSVAYGWSSIKSPINQSVNHPGDSTCRAVFFAQAPPGAGEKPFQSLTRSKFFNALFKTKNRNRKY